MLRTNIKDQLNRLFDQLEDLEDLRDELTPEEYNEEKEDTIQQLQDFQEFLQVTFSSNISLSTEFTPAQEAIKKALLAMNSAATNAVGQKGGPSGQSSRLRLLAETNTSLRQRLVELDRNLKLKLITPDNFTAQAGDIVLSLQAAGEKLTPMEEELLVRIGTRHSLLTTTTATNATDSILASAYDAVSKAQNQ